MDERRRSTTGHGARKVVGGSEVSSARGVDRTVQVVYPEGADWYFLRGGMAAILSLSG